MRKCDFPYNIFSIPISGIWYDVLYLTPLFCFYLQALDVSGNDNVKRGGATALAHLAQRNKKFKKFAFLNEELDETGLDMLRLLSIAASNRSERSQSVPLQPQPSKTTVSKSDVVKKIAEAALRRKTHA
mmetsp:Transcript_21356/g.29921  ORF Transcript_21356/g.29921 Transcript_21356/m.29921 type:complete len:129 (-) Transcript_21356:178-564(-)